MRTFETGATRDSDAEKIDPEGFFSPLVIQRYCDYMQRHQTQADGKIRVSDNWQKGIPRDAYMKSLWRHFLDVWLVHRGCGRQEDQQELLCAILFNAMGYLHVLLKTEIAERPENTGVPGKRSDNWDAS